MIYFLTEERLKDFTLVLDNVDFKLINPAIQTNALMWIQPILGTYFMDYLLDKYNTQSLSNDEAKVVEKVQSALAWRVASDVVITSHSQITNKGIQVQNGMNSEPSTVRQMGILTQNFNAKATYFESDLYSFLRNNKNLFPQYTDKRNSDCRGFSNKLKENDLGNAGIYFL